MMFFVPLLILASVFSIQADPILPRNSGSQSFMDKREVIFSKRSPVQQVLATVVETVKRSIAEIDGHQEEAFSDVFKRAEKAPTTIVNDLEALSKMFGDNGPGLPKILSIVLEILQEADIIKDIMAIVSKVTKAVVQRVFSLGKDKSSSKASAADSTSKGADSSKGSNDAPADGDAE
jgi:hypothetical protein